jgi:vacuolar-type H+-ATPase subunit C/Vma6
VSVVWADVSARARGLSTRLLGGDALRRLARAHDLDALAEQLASVASEFAPQDLPPSTLGIELAARRTVAARLLILARWCAERTEFLAPLFDAEDHRSIRAALRGAAAGAPPELRRAGLIATPNLPERALDELADQPTPAAVAALLAAWEHPFASAIIDEARREQPDLYLLEKALDARFAERAERAARRDGEPMRDLVKVTIVAQRAFTALMSDSREKDLAMLAAELPRTALGRLLARGTAPRADELERAVLETQLDHQHAHTLRDPLGPGPVLYFVIRLRAEVRDLMRIAHGVALGAPRAMLAAGVVSR